MRFSVVIPTAGRRPEMLAEAVASVRMQTIPAFELVVVVDGSQDIDEETLEGAQVIHKPKSGVAATRNAGVRATTGEWLCFLDDDDLWLPERLEITANYLAEHSGCAAVNAGYRLQTADGALTDLDMSYLAITGRSYELLLERNRGNTTTGTIRRDIFEAAGGFPEGWTCAEDWLLWLRVAALTEWHYIDQRLGVVRQHAGQNTATSPDGLLTMLRAIAVIWADGRQKPRPLASYGPDYRWTAQAAIYGALRARRPGIAASAVRTGWPLLPRWRDRLYAVTPPPLTWRLDQLRTRGGTVRRASAA